MKVNIRQIVDALETIKDIMMEQDNAVTPDLIDALDIAIEAVVKLQNLKGRRPVHPFEGFEFMEAFFDEFLGGKR